MKTEVYSWRVEGDLKTELEREARRRKLSLSAVLDVAARDWLHKTAADARSEEEQQRLRESASQCFGAFAGGDILRSKNTRQSVRERLRRHRGR